MKSFRRRAALDSAVGSSSRRSADCCEPLERRVLLAANDPVLVLVEPIQEYLDIHTIPDVEPYLWRSPIEANWTLEDFDQQPPPWDSEDRDGNGYPDDAYGWNFLSNSPNFILGDGSDAAGHGRFVTLAAVGVLNSAGAQASRVRIMYVISAGGLTVNSGTASPPLQYILDRKASGVNIVAVGTKLSLVTRTGADALNNAGIMLVGGESFVSNPNLDDSPGNTTNAFFSATPRSGVQAAALDNIIPATTDPTLSFAGHGINSYYAGVPGHSFESFAGPAAAAMAAVAVQAYQDEHNGQNPTIQQIKRAMMSGVDYIPQMHNRTITHDYDNDPVHPGRKDGGLFNLDKIIDAINDTDPGITGVSMTQLTVDPLGTEVQFSLNSIGEPTNWTISWGDNSFADKSGVQVLPVAQPSVLHTFSFENVPHRYYPTIYAMLGTGVDRQVYLQAAQLEVVVTTPFAPTSGQDNYTLARSGDNTVLTLQNSNGSISHSFAPGELPRAFLTLGQVQDTLTVDFSNGNPLASTELTVTGLEGTGPLLRVIGTANNDSISVSNGTLVTVNGTEFTINLNVAVFVDAGAGDDEVDVVSPAATLLGGDGHDVISTGDAGNYYVETGDGNDVVYGGDGNDHIVMGSWINGGQITYGTKNIFGGGGDDIIDTLLDHSETEDLIHGGDGWDKIIVWSGSTRSFLGEWEAIEEVEET